MASEENGSWNTRLLKTREHIPSVVGQRCRYISIKIYAFKATEVEVDGRRAIKANPSTPKPYPLEGIGQALGTDATIEWAEEDFRLKWVTVRIGSQILRYDREP